MLYFIVFILGCILGGAFGIAFMCMFQINRTELKHEYPLCRHTKKRKGGADGQQPKRT